MPPRTFQSPWVMGTAYAALPPPAWFIGIWKLFPQHLSFLLSASHPSSVPVWEAAHLAQLFGTPHHFPEASLGTSFGACWEHLCFIASVECSHGALSVWPTLQWDSLTGEALTGWPGESLSPASPRLYTTAPSPTLYPQVLVTAWEASPLHPSPVS